MSTIYVKYIEIDLLKPCWSSRKGRKAEELERLLLKERNSKVTFHAEGRGTTSFFVLAIGDQGQFFFTAHRKKYKWMISEFKNTSNFWMNIPVSNLQRQLKEKLKKGYSVDLSDETPEITVPIAKIPYFIDRSTPLIIRTIEYEEEPLEVLEPLSMIDLMLM